MPNKVFRQRARADYLASRKALAEDRAQEAAAAALAAMIEEREQEREQERQQQLQRRHAEPWTPMAHQIPPAGEPGVDWSIWLIEGARMAGKTRAGAEYCRAYLKRWQDQARVYIGAPTRDDVRDICAEGPSGLITLYPDEFDWHRSDRQAFHKDGGYVRFLGSEEPDRWNGPGFGLLWADEIALWRNRASWDMAQLCLRETAAPHAIVTTTPKRSSLVREIKKLPGTKTTHAVSRDNVHIAEQRLTQLEAMFGVGSRLHRQEMLAEDVGDVEGALWKFDWIEDNRRLHAVREQMQRIVISIDPAGTRSKRSDLTALAVIGLGWDNDLYVLQAEADKWSPNAWASRALALYAQYQADKFVAETNYGGEMVRSTLATVWRDGIAGVLTYGELPFEKVVATRGKMLRADPIAAMYEQRRVHHAGYFTEAEDQMTSFGTDECERDDLVDAIVWGLTYFTQSVLPELLIVTGVKGWHIR